MVFVVLSGLLSNVEPTDLAEKINSYFGKNKEIGTFRMKIDESNLRRPKAVLKFKQGFDAMEAQRLLDNFQYVDSEHLIYKLKAKVPSNDQHYQTLFCEEVPDVEVIVDEELTRKKKRKHRKKGKKREHSPIVISLLSEDSNLSKDTLETAEIERLEKLHKKPKEKSEKMERRSSQSDWSASETEYLKKIRNKSIYGESSGVSKRPKSPEESVPKKKFRSEQRSTRENREKSRSTWTPESLSPSRISSNSPMKTSKRNKRAHSPEEAASSKSHDSIKVNVGWKEFRRPSDAQSPGDRRRRNSLEQTRCKSTFQRAIEDITKMTTRPSVKKSKPREYASYYEPTPVRVHVKSPRGSKVSLSGESSRSKNERRSSNESTDTKHTAVPQHRRAKKLLLLDPSQYLNEKNPEFNEAVQHIIYSVTRNTERLLEEDKQLILENYTATVVKRLKSLKFTNLMSVQDIVLDYKLTYKTADDKLLINKLIKELQALGKGVLRPEIKMNPKVEKISSDEDEANVKPKVKTENTVEYEYDNGEATEVINIVVNLIPIEKRVLPLETDPDKVAEIKVFVSTLRYTTPPKFFRPIRSLLNEMKLYIYKNAKVVPCEVIFDRMVEVLEKILARMLRPIKTRIKTKGVCNLFRNSFPYKEDREFVDMIIKWIVDGEFDKGEIDGLITEKMPNIIKNFIKKVKAKKANGLPASVKAEPRDTESTDANPTMPAPIKIEKKDNDDVKQSEQTVTTNISGTEEQKTKDEEIKTQEQSNVDKIVKKEVFELISIEDDDDLVIKKEPKENSTEQAPIKIENKDNDDVKQSEQTVTKNVSETEEQKTKDEQIKTQEQSNVDKIVKKEVFELISIDDDDDLVIKKEPKENSTEQAPIMIENKNNEKTNKQQTKQSEKTVTKNVSGTEEQKTKDKKIKTQERSNVNTIVKKELLEVISIEEDDDLVIKKEPKENIPSKVKLETINISDSEDEGAESDDSRSTQIIETKPHIYTDLNVDQGIPVPNKPLESEKISNEPSDIMGEFGETIDDIRLYLKSETN